MRCIEIQKSAQPFRKDKKINYNMRCIEIRYFLRPALLVSVINYNMRCIEIAKKEFTQF